MNKKALAVAIAGAIAVPMSAQAVEVKLSGQVDKAILFADDGHGSDVLFVDNDNSSSRFRLAGSEDIGNGIKAGVVLEYEMQSNPSNTATIKQAAAGHNSGTAGLTERYTFLYFQGGWGKVHLGQIQSASDATAERDLSGTSLVSLGNGVLWGGGNLFRTAAGGSLTAVSANYTYYDGLSRLDGVRYDTPTLGPGIVISAGAYTNDQWDVAASIRTSFAGGKLDAGFGYASAENAGGFDQWDGSASFLFSQGTSITVRYGERDRTGGGAAGRQSEDFGVKLGHKFGRHALSIDYNETDDHAAVGTDAEGWGVNWVYDVGKGRVELFASYRNFELSTAGTEDVDVFGVGSRVKF